MVNKTTFYGILVFIFGIFLIGCPMDSTPTYTVWVSTESYSEYQNAFGTLNDGSYRRIEVFSGEIDYSALPNEFKRKWTENDIYNYLYGRGFISSEAREVTAWIVSTRHCIIASRSGGIVYMLIK
jgi:hypothetical protein